MPRTLLALLLLLSLGAQHASAAGKCRAAGGLHVTLFGGVDDPDVLVWDSQDRLERYSAGSVDARQFLLPHALLNRPGTRAVVLSCRANAVRPKFSGGTADAIGLKILSGRYRGRYGWVSSSDVHGSGMQEARDEW